MAKKKKATGQLGLFGGKKTAETRIKVSGYTRRRGRLPKRNSRGRFVKGG